MRPRFIRIVLTFASFALAGGLMAPAGADPHCTDLVDDVLPTGARISLGGEALSGLYALPEAPATQLVVFAHGYRNTSAAWIPHLERFARDHGVVAVAMDYRGTGPVDPVRGNYRGFPIANGAEDSIAAAKHFLAACSTLTKVFILGVSMGGNVSGFAVAEQPKRADGMPLFDYWIEVEGVTNITETYFEARAASAGGDQYIVGARDDIQAENGGTFEEMPEEYLRRTIVARAGDIAASGVKGVVVVHGVDDGLVPYNQAREMVVALRAAGVPTDVFTVVSRGGGETGTTMTGHVAGPLFGALGLEPYESPLPGHGWEGSTTHAVIKTGLDRLGALLANQLVLGRDEVV